MALDLSIQAFWPRCAVYRCPNKSCLALDSARCFVHTPGSRHVKGWKIDARALPARFVETNLLPLNDGQR